MSFSFAVDVAAPYPGLRPFSRSESVIFFGRDRQIDDVLARLKAHRFLGIVGTSGCGKSSLVRAGMLPALESGLMGELGSTWFVADMKPGDAPLTNLAKALINSGVLGQRWSDTPEGIALLTAVLRRSDLSLVNLIRQIQLPQYTNLLVLADQFEEIFRFQQHDPNEASAFVNLMLETSRERSVPIYIVSTMRTDFLGQCALFPGLPEALNDGQYLCPRLSRDQLAEAIEGPATAFGASVEPLLVTQLLNDAGANSDQLPLVQHMLARIWDRLVPIPVRIERVLRVYDYRQVGGLKEGSAQCDSPTESKLGTSHQRAGGMTQNALSQHADEAYFSLGDDTSTNADHGTAHRPSRRQMIARMLFQCLAERGPSGQYIRRPVTVEHVAGVAGCSVSDVIKVVEVFRREDRSFLVPPAGVNLVADSVLDISHEALIRQWKRFGGHGDRPGEHESEQSWLEIEEESRRRYRRLAEAGENEQWAGLLRNPELALLNQWWEACRPTQAWADARINESFNRTQSFLRRSLAAEKAAARNKRLLSIFVIVLALLVFAGMLATMVFSNLRSEAVTLQQSEHEQRKRSLSVSASFAARTIADKIDIRLRILEAMADDPHLHEIMNPIDAEPQNETLRIPLQDWLNAQREKHAHIKDHSWSILVSDGSPVARYPQYQLNGELFVMLKQRYNYRDYFHGMLSDFETGPPIEQSHISIAMVDHAGDLNFALSTPIKAHADEPPLGVINMFIELGQFADLAIPLPAGQKVILVDTRRFYMKLNNSSEKGPSGEGLLLHHPDLANIATPDELPHLEPSMVKYMRDFDHLHTDNLLPANYRDPISNAAEGLPLAAFAPVILTARPTETDVYRTNWFVIIQQQ